MAFNLGVKNGAAIKGAWPGVVTQVKTISEEARSIDFIYSDETLDRDREIIRAQGWQLEPYRKNPVFLFAHEHWAIPIGRSVQTWIADKALLGRVKFATAENGNEAGEAFFRLYRDGFMNCVSVGFVALQRITSGHWDELLPSGARCEFVEQELMECSAVPVPANPNAGVLRSLEPGMADDIRRELDGMKSKGIVHEETLSAITGAYDRLEQRKALWFPVKECRHEEPCEEVRRRGECEYHHDEKGDEKAEPVIAPIAPSENPTPKAAPPVIPKGGQVLSSQNRERLTKMHECCHDMMASAGMPHPDNMPGMEPPEEMPMEEEAVGEMELKDMGLSAEDITAILEPEGAEEDPEEEILALLEEALSEEL